MNQNIETVYSCPVCGTLARRPAPKAEEQGACSQECARTLFIAAQIDRSISDITRVLMNGILTYPYKA